MPTFPTPRPVSVTLELPVARIRLHASDRAGTVVAVHPGDPGKSADVQAAERTRVEHTDGRLESAHTPERSAETATVRAHTSYGDIVIRRSAPGQRPA